MRPRCTLLAALLVGLVPACAQQARPKNVIIMIADGGGFHQYEAGSLFRYGATGKAVWDAFPVQLAASTFAVNGGYDPAAVWASFEAACQKPTDSAAAATALATGHKTKNGMIGVDPDGQPLKNLVEQAEAKGKASGVVSSVPLSHATPAGFVAHANSRGSYAEIGQQMILKSACEVVIGGGHPDFDGNHRPRKEPRDEKAWQYVGGQETWEAVKRGEAGADANGDGTADRWTLVDTREGLVKLASGPAPARLLGVAPVADTLQSGRAKGDPKLPGDDPLLAAVPTLPELTRAALNVLDDDPDGLFLMVEGGAVDWASHSNDLIRAVEELNDFEDAVKAVCDWVEQHSSWEQTLLIVTSDHETGCLGAAADAPLWQPLTVAAAGQLPAVSWHSKGHSNQLVPVRAKGVGAELLRQAATKTDPHRGPYLDNTDLPKTVFRLWE